MEPYLWQIHFLSAFSPTFLRIIVGFYFLYIGKFLFDERARLLQIRSIPLIGHMQPWMPVVSSLATCTIGIMLMAGMQTSLAAVIGGILCIKHWYATRDYAQYVPFPASTYFLLLVLCISLLVTGAGIFAIDSPLY